MNIFFSSEKTSRKILYEIFANYLNKKQLIQIITHQRSRVMIDDDKRNSNCFFQSYFHTEITFSNNYRGRPIALKKLEFYLKNTKFIKKEEVSLILIVKGLENLSRKEQKNVFYWIRNADSKFKIFLCIDKIQKISNVFDKTKFFLHRKRKTDCIIQKDNLYVKMMKFVVDIEKKRQKRSRKNLLLERKYYIISRIFYLFSRGESEKSILLKELKDFLFSSFLYLSKNVLDTIFSTNSFQSTNNYLVEKCHQIEILYSKNIYFLTNPYIFTKKIFPN